MIKKLITIFLCFSFILVSCTKLDEKLNGQLTFDQIASGGGSANTAALLNGVYNSMQLPFQNHERVLSLWEMTGDGLLGPTRGPDWDDNGQLRVLYAHSWTPDHPFIRNIFDDLNGVVFGATDMLQFNPTTQQQAEGPFSSRYGTIHDIRWF